MKHICLGICGLALIFVLVIAIMLAAGRRCDFDFYNVGEIDGPKLQQMQLRLRSTFIPQWVPNGHHLVFNLKTPSGVNRSITYVVSYDGSELIMLFKPSSKYDGSHSPDVSPDGNEVIYTTLRHLTDNRGNRIAGSYEIEKVRLDGSERTRLTTSREFDAAPAWSPDGKNIAFVRESGYDRGIYTMSADGTKERLIFPFDLSGETSRSFRHHLTGPTWSSDGIYIAFSVEEPRDVEDPIDYQELYIVRSDGTWHNKVFSWPITSHQTNPISIPSWAPKDNILAFAVSSQNENAIYVVRPDGDKPTKVLEKYGGKQLEWSPDGEEILSSQGFVVRPDGTGFREIFPTGLSGRVAWSPDGRRIAVSTEDGRLITLSRDGTGLSTLVETDENGMLVIP